MDNDEQNYIRRNYTVLHPGDIAEHLNRSPKSIVEYIQRNLKQKTDIYDVDLFDIKTRKNWPDIKRQLSDEEIPIFEYHWNEIIKQFNKDVTHTEELQIIDVVRQEILASRCLKAQQDNANAILRRETELADVKSQLSGPLSDPERRDLEDRVFNIERQIGVLRAAQDTVSKDYKTYQEQKMKLFDKIKGSRDQRVSKIEDQKNTFAQFILRLRKDPNFSKKLSIEMEKMRLSTLKQVEQLGQIHKFADNRLDRCILNDSTVFMDDIND